MNCPSCNSNLYIVERHGVDVDYCRSCRGIWLEEETLDLIVERARSESRVVRIPSVTSQRNASMERHENQRRETTPVSADSQQTCELADELSDDLLRQAG